MIIVTTARFFTVVIGFTFFLFLYRKHIDISNFLLRCTSSIKLRYIIIIHIFIIMRRYLRLCSK